MVKVDTPPSETVFPESAVKAHLIGIGSGTLEFINNTIKFQIKKGRFRKRKEVVRQIQMTDIEEMNRVGKELSITWKDSTDIFIIEEPELAETLFEKIPKASEEQVMIFEEKEVAKQKQSNVSKIITVAMEITDSLFNILSSLNGWVDWNRVEEDFSKGIEKNLERVTQITAIDWDFTKLTLSIKERAPEKISREIYNLLKVINGYFSELDTEKETPEEIHPNVSDTKMTIKAYFLLNDIILGVKLGDEEIEKEKNLLLMVLSDLSETSGLKLEMDTIKDIIGKLVIEKGNKNISEKSRAMFRLQLKNLLSE
jgi:hypothetical protein